MSLDSTLTGSPPPRMVPCRQDGPMRRMSKFVSSKYTIASAKRSSFTASPFTPAAAKMSSK
eukprot:5789985-Prymnesium_polylepis.1